MNRTYVPGKTYYRLPPCPAYDIAKTESWLSDLAEEGLFLAKDGFFAGVATFEGREPAHVKYRLEAIQKIDGFFSNAGLEPDEEQLELSEKYSWEYVAKRKDFFIYRSLDPDARELNTDPEVHALTLNAVKKRQREAVCTAVFLLLLYPILITRGCVLLMTIALGTWCASLGFLWGVLTLVDEIVAFVYLKKTQKCLQSEGHYRFAPDWRKHARSYFLRKAMKNAVAVLLPFD